MNARTLIPLALALSLLAISVPVHGDDELQTDDPTCVTLWTDPPDVQVDPGCVWVIIDDLPVAPAA